MRPIIAFLFLTVPAQAHIGHLGEAAGHGHLIAGAALGLAGLITLVAGLKGKKDRQEAEPKECATEEKT